VGETRPGVFGRRLRYFRRLRGLTQGELARQAGMSRPTISAAERGEQQSISFDSLVRISDVLGVSIDRLLREDVIEEDRTPALA
jgi:XRE family transcriptional regulator, master regulator for biofilm formation